MIDRILTLARRAWDRFLELREHEEERWRETVELDSELSVESTEPSSCGTALHARPLSELVEERQNEARYAGASKSEDTHSNNHEAAPFDLTELVSQRQGEQQHAEASSESDKNSSESN